ncbi:MAG: type II toxin-antitoxin system prevent-host-death family antitoxin [Balneolaceae bacterium]
MKKVKVKEVREHLADYLSDAEKGEEIIITKHSRPVARLVSLEPSSPLFPDLSDHRKSITVKNSPVSETIIDLRKKERY